MARFANAELKQIDQLLKEMNSENTHRSLGVAWKYPSIIGCGLECIILLFVLLWFGKQNWFLKNLLKSLHCQKDLTFRKTAKLKRTKVNYKYFILQVSLFDDLEKGICFLGMIKQLLDPAMIDIEFIQSRQVISNSDKPSSDITCLD